MKQKTLFLIFLWLFFLPGCQVMDAALLTDTAVPPSTAVPTATTILQPQDPTPLPIPPTPTTQPTDTPQIQTPVQPATTGTDGATDLAVTPDELFLYPIPYLVDGDLATIQVIPTVPTTVDWQAVSVHVLLDGRDLTNSGLVWRNLASRPEALFEWVWDTTGQTGEHQLEIVLDRDDRIQVGDENPDNNRLVTAVTVQPITVRSAAEVNAAWVTSENNCCRVHVVTGTAAHRDLPQLLATLDAATAEAANRLDEPLQQKIEIYFVDRVLGQGGYAGSAIVISYLDRQYNGQGLYETLVHESVHVIDRQFAPQRIAILAEGVAVWATGGHYKSEDLNLRNAALVSLGEYVPLSALADDFYPVQHEIGYLEAGGFVEYLINTYGWTRFREFYIDVNLDDAPTPSAALDLNLQRYYDKSLADMEAEWQRYLTGLELPETAVTDLATTIRYYDVMRRYQTHYDPAAYFLTAWLPYPEDVEEKGNPADLTRRSHAEVNVTLEAMLASTDDALRTGNYNRANVLLDSITRVLDNDGAFLDPLATNYLNIVRLAAAEGYEVQRVTLNGDQAELLVTKTNTTNLKRFSMVLRGQDWILTN